MRTLFKTVVLGLQYGLGARIARDPGRYLALRGRRNPGATAGPVPRVRRLRAKRARPRRPQAGDQHAVRLGDAMPARDQPEHSPKFSDAVGGLRDPARARASWPSGAGSRSSRRCTMP